MLEQHEAEARKLLEQCQQGRKVVAREAELLSRRRV
jgi:hypothetical protein